LLRIYIIVFQPSFINSFFIFDMFFYASDQRLRIISIWWYCMDRERKGKRGNEYTFLLRLCFNRRIDGGTVCNKQTDLGQEIRFERSFRRALLMALDSEHRRDIPFVHDVFYRVIKPKAKSTIFELSLLFLFLSLSFDRERDRN